MYARLASRFGLMVAVLLALAGPASGQVVFQTQDLRLEIGADGLGEKPESQSFRD